MNDENNEKGGGRINIFDDEVDDEDFKRVMARHHEDISEEGRNSVTMDDNDDDVVNLDGSSLTFKPKKLHGSVSRPSTLLPDAPRGHGRSLSNTTENRKHGSHLVFPTPKLSNTVSEPSIEEVVSQSRNNPTREDINMLEQEIMKLRAQVKVHSDRWVPLPINDTIDRITLSQPYSLELYTSRRSKVALLERALAVHDGNAILAVTLFLKVTLSPSKFMGELKNYPVACDIYLSYLKSRYDHSEMLAIYRRMGQKEELAMLEYKLSLSQDTNPDVQIRNLQTCYRNHYQGNPALATDAALIQEHIALLERQRPIEASDREAETTGASRLFQEHPRNASITNMSVITTLYYCSFYHYDKMENHLACPESIRKQHQLTEKQYFWPVLSARSRLKCWSDIEKMTSAKGWFGNTKLRSVIGLDKVADVLYKTGAPPLIIAKYLRAIDDADKKLALAKSYQCHDVVIDTLVSTKNREALEVYKSALPTNTQEYIYARDALNNSSTKWKP